MKKTLCFALIIALLLALPACGRTAEPTPEPQGPQYSQDQLEQALAYLRLRDRDWNYVGAHLGTYQELYKLTHPGADVLVLGGGIGAKEVFVQVTGADAKAFAEAGIFSDRITVHPKKNGDPCFSQDLPIPREP